MNLKIISWNVRGLNDCEKRLRIRNMIRGWGVDIICLLRNKNGIDNKERDLELVGLSTFGLAIFGLYWCFGVCFGDVG